MDHDEFQSMRGSDLWKLPDPTPEQRALFEHGLYFCDHCLAPLTPKQERYCSRACRYYAYGEAMDRLGYWT